MSHRGVYGSVRKAHAGSPLFVECDHTGRVLWMSDRSRSALDEAKDAGILPVSVLTELLGPLHLISAVYFYRLLERGDRVLIGVQFIEPDDELRRQEASGLMAVQSNLLRHYFRLQHAERSLATRARRHRPGSPNQSVFQIERERRRLGRELHTGVGQMLAAIRLQLEIIGSQTPGPAPPVQQALNRISTLASEALSQVRAVSHRLHPPEWQRLSLEAAIQQLWDISGIPQTYETSVEIEPLPEEPSLDVKVLMYRATQEALSNLTRHARATRIDLTLAAAAGNVVLTIRDNGVGFDTARQFSAPANVAAGIGLRSIREQAASVGGKLVVESGPTGTRLELIAPLPGSSNDDARS